MAKTSRIFLCGLMVIMDAVAGILGIEANIAQNKKKHLNLGLIDCGKGSLDAYFMGLAAVALLGLAHLLANFLGGCACFCCNNRKCSLSFLIITWIVWAVGCGMLLVGAMSNQKSGTACGLTQREVLYNGGISCFVHGLFGVVYFITAMASR